MIVVHHLNNSRSQRVLWLLAELGLPYEIKPIAKAISGKVKSAFISLQIRQHLDYMEAELGKAPWFAGKELTGADIQMSFPIEARVVKGGLDASRPKLMDFLKRIQARPACKRALKKGGAYELYPVLRSPAAIPLMEM